MEWTVTINGIPTKMAHTLDVNHITDLGYAADEMQICVFEKHKKVAIGLGFGDRTEANRSEMFRIFKEISEDIDNRTVTSVIEYKQ